jgi:hypothetical protein
LSNAALLIAAIHVAQGSKNPNADRAMEKLSHRAELLRSALYWNSFNQ